ncbi:MAG: hypothetical protein ACNA8L_10305 [Luteolibacter sp.]
MPDLDTITDALIYAQGRGAMPTSLGTAELRELGAEVLARSVFTAKGTNAVFVGMLQKFLNELAAGRASEGQVRTALAQLLDVLGYDAEAGGFPGEELEPAVAGSLQDLRSFRRRDLIVRTQRDLMAGAGQKMRGSDPARLRAFPAWELVRDIGVEDARDWEARWTLAGGRTEPRADAYRQVGARTNMIALKGDPVWGELGASGNFSDALDVDHPPFCFNSGMGWREVSAAEVRAAGITGPAGEDVESFLQSRPVTLTGPQELPRPQISLKTVPPEVVEEFKKETGAVETKPYVFTYDDILKRALQRSAAERAQRGGGQ